MLREHKQIRVPETMLARGLAETDLPGEPVAYIKLSPDELARRFDLAFQHSFDNLDAIELALIEFSSGERVALIHHQGFPENETELFVDPSSWQRRDVVDDVLQTMSIRATELSWRQPWPTTA